MIIILPLNLLGLIILGEINDNFEKLSAAQLNKIIDETQAELTRRKTLMRQPLKFALS